VIVSMVNTKELDVSKRNLIQDLFNEYAQVVDNGVLSKWPDFFAENGSYYVYGRDNYDQGLPVAFIMDDHKGKIKDRVTLVEKIWTYNFFYQRHQITNILVKETDDNKLSCAANFSIYTTSREGKTDLFAVGRYEDIIVFEENKPKIEQRKVILDTFTLPSYFVYPL
jgi:3-phenylpropionate/cinnamic acid dioxygenase small subunit